METPQTVKDQSTGSNVSSLDMMMGALQHLLGKEGEMPGFPSDPAYLMSWQEVPAKTVYHTAYNDYKKI